MSKKTTASIKRLIDDLKYRSENVRQTIELYNSKAEKVWYPTIGMEEIQSVLLKMEETVLVPENFILDKVKRINVYTWPGNWSRIYTVPAEKQECDKLQCCKKPRHSKAKTIVVFALWVLAWIILLSLI